MRAIPLILAMTVSNTALAQSVPIEPDAIINSRLPREVIDPAVQMIRAYGWRCDSISAARPYLMSRGFTIVCNEFGYTYNLEDKGGRWVVDLEE